LAKNFGKRLRGISLSEIFVLSACQISQYFYLLSISLIGRQLIDFLLKGLGFKSICSFFFRLKFPFFSFRLIVSIKSFWRLYVAYPGFASGALHPFNLFS